MQYYLTGYRNSLTSSAPLLGRSTLENWVHRQLKQTAYQKWKAKRRGMTIVRRQATPTKSQRNPVHTRVASVYLCDCCADTTEIRTRVRYSELQHRRQLSRLVAHTICVRLVSAEVAALVALICGLCSGESAQYLPQTLRFSGERQQLRRRHSACET